MNDRAATDPALDVYQRNGFAVFPGVIDADLIAEAREHIDWLQRRHPALRPEHFHHPLMRDDAFWVRLVTDDRLLNIAQQFIGPNLACFTAHYICKPPMDGQAVLWHQDAAYWNLEPMQGVTLWLAIDDCDTENGCLRMISGTHQGDIGAVVLRDDVPNMLHSSVDPRMVAADRAVDVPLTAGDVSVHHPKIIHGSEANRSTRRRCGLDIGYIPTSTRIGDTGLYMNPILVRGDAIEGTNRYRQWPAYDPDNTIPFRDCAQWNTRAEEMNRRPGIVGPSGLSESVDTLTAQMMERLRAGTTKTPRTSR